MQDAYLQANGVEHTATELNTAMTALKRAIADKADTKASGNYVNADANKRQAYDEKVTVAENIVSGTPTPTLTPSDVTNANNASNECEDTVKR